MNICAVVFICIVYYDYITAFPERERVRGRGKHACSSGPYIFDAACFHQSQGIGSSMNKMKIQILAAFVFNLTVIPNPSCFYSDEHSTDMMVPFGWDYNLDCNWNMIQRSLNSSLRNNGHLIPFPTVVTVALDEKRIVSKDGNTMCNAVAQNPQSTAIRAHLDTFAVPGSYGIWSELLKAISSRTDSGDQRSTIYYLERPYISYNIEGYQCSLAFVSSRFHAARERQQRAVSFEKDVINVAFHFRYGDTAKPDPTYPKEPNWDVDYSEQHRLPLKEGIKLLQALLGDKSALRSDKTRIHFFSEGDAKLFHKFQTAFPQALFHLGNQTSMLQDLDHLSEADVLLGGPSSFTSLAAALNRFGVKVVPRSKDPSEDKFLGIDRTVGQGKILQGDMSEFNTMICSSPQYAETKTTLLRCS